MDTGDDVVRDANGYSYATGVSSQIARYQAVSNIDWPQRDKDGPHARGIRPAQHADGTPWTIDVLVRLEFERDGEVVLPGRAERWTSSHTYVVVDDPRVQGGFVWLKAADVRRW